jgi:hypothetical protein
LRVLKDHRVYRVYKDHRVYKVKRVSGVLRAILAIKGIKVI